MESRSAKCQRAFLYLHPYIRLVDYSCDSEASGLQSKRFLDSGLQCLHDLFSFRVSTSEQSEVLLAVDRDGMAADAGPLTRALVREYFVGPSNPKPQILDPQAQV